MRIEVKYRNHKGQLTSKSYSMTRLAFAKHLAIAGQAYAPCLQKFIRSVGMYWSYSYYIQKRAFNEDRFSEPPTQLSDPTEKSHFSNLAGKAIADFLSKRIDQSIFTVNYEAAMRLRNMPIKGCRPDLLAYKSNKNIFAIEAKGYSGGCGDMDKHKNQSQQGLIPVNFSVACVSYNLYNKVRCKYYDPFNDNIPFNEDLFRELTKNYYKGLLEFLNFPYKKLQIQDEVFYEVELFPHFFEEFLLDNIHFRYCRGFYRDVYYCCPRLILPGRITEYAEEGLPTETRPFSFEGGEQVPDLYIDNDRVGLITSYNDV